MKRHSFLARAAVTLLLAVLSTVTAWADDFQFSGAGTKSNPYKIGSVYELRQLRLQSQENNFDGVYFQLTNDIVFDDTQWNNFFPTIASGNVYFQGVFDGNGHTISGIRTDKTKLNGSLLKENYCQGIFGSIGQNGVVKNLKVANTQIHAYNMSGIIASYSEGTITDCTIGSDVELYAMYPNGSQYGSIAGLVRGGTISGCLSAANITLNDANGGYNSMGGLVGELNGGTVRYSVFTGFLQESSLSTNTNNFAVVGKLTSGNIYNCCYTNNSLKGGYSNVSFAYTVTVPSQFLITGEQGQKYSTYKGVHIDNKFYIEPGATFYVFPAQGYGTSSFDVKKTSDNTTLTTNAAGSYTMPAFDITLIYKGNMPYYDSSLDCYVIDDAETWNMVAECVAAGIDFSGKTVRMYYDITTSTPIGDSSHPFKGNFNGLDNYDRTRTITFNATATGEYCAPFANINGATIHDVKVAGTINTNYKNTSGLVGKVSGGTSTIENVQSTLVINSTYNGDAYHGGFVSDIASGATLTVNNCVFNGGLLGTDTRKWGGFVGKNNGKLNLTKCLFYPNSYSVNIVFYSSTFVNGSANTMTQCYHYEASSFESMQGKQGYAATLPSAVIPYNTSAGVLYNGKLYLASNDVAVLKYVVTSGQDGVTIAAMTAKDESNKNVTVTANSDETYSITMPAKNITVTGVMKDLWGLAGGADGSEEHPYVITTTEGLDLLATKVNGSSSLRNYQGTYFKLGGDIAYSHDANDTWDLESSTTNNYTCIGANWGIFCGHFDGDNHTISGIRINTTDSYVGLFSQLYTNDAEIKNLILDDTRITSTGSDIGGILGYTGDENAQSKVTNCHVKNVLVIGSNSVGGVVARTNRGVVSSCTSKAKVIANGQYASRVGGIVGENDGVIKDCFYYGDGVTCTNGNSAYRSAGVITVNDKGSLQNNYYLPCTVKIGNTTYTSNNGVGKPAKETRNGLSFTYTQYPPEDVSANDGGLPVYALTINAVSNGTIAADTKAISHDSKDYFKADATVTVTATPDEGYSISSLTYNDGSNHDITSSKTFTMPAKAVSISAAFSENKLTLSETSNNDAVLSKWNGQIAKVTLSKYTLYKDGSWNSLCLPFDLTIAGSCLDGNGVVAKVFSSSSNMTNGVVRLDFINAPATIPAGTPFIIKWTNGSKSSKLNSPEFTGVTINNAAPAAVVSNDGNLTFAGSFNPIANTKGENDLMYDEHNSIHGACRVTLFIKEPTRTGYTLTGGWNTSADGKGEDITTIPFDVVVYAKGDKNVLALADNANNSTAIAAAAADGKVYEVTLNGRTLQAGGWNTFCVPFEISSDLIESVLGADAKVRALSTSSLSNDVLTLNFTNATTIEAGKPYLVKVSSKVENPVFSGVTVVDGTTTTETDEVDFVPVMNPTELNANDKSVLFIKGGNTLTYPTATGNMNGFRAYFLLHDANSARSFNMNFGDGETTNIEHSILNIEHSNDSVYDLQGRKVANPSKGLYIVNGRKYIKH